MPQKDNSSLDHKVALRRHALKVLAEAGVDTPVVCETHGGQGVIFDACYAHLTQGMVMERDPEKCAKLGKQRPSWAVYETDCETALEAGVGAHLTFDLLDCDPYGSPWDTIEGFFTSERPFAPRMVVAVHDGLRENLEMGVGWKTRALHQVIERRGNDLHPIYLEVCRELIEEHAARASYTLAHFAGLYSGKRGKLTHYLAILEQER